MSQLNITAATSVSISGEQGGTHRRKQPWEEMLQELREYRQHYGDSIVHTHETKLGRWVSTQRQRYFKDELTKGQIESLEALQFAWKLKETHQPAQA